MPGTPGTKEVYGVSIIRAGLLVTIPPKAFKIYDLSEAAAVLLTTTHRGEGGFGLMKKETAEATVFSEYIQQIHEIDALYWFNNKEEGIHLWLYCCVCNIGYLYILNYLGINCDV